MCEPNEAQKLLDKAAERAKRAAARSAEQGRQVEPQKQRTGGVRFIPNGHIMLVEQLG